ncbi:MAG: anti-sigma regulatory factor [Actinomycetota bacterium]
MTSTTTLTIRLESDILAARQHGREVAERLGFRGSDLALIATAISEVARNIVVHAGEGAIMISALSDGRAGVEIVARDAGPGIADIELAMQDGFSTVASLGLGLPGSRRLMDEFTIESHDGQGTTVIMRKWLTTQPGR